MMSEKSLEEDGSVKEDINSEVVTGVGSDVDQGNGDGLSSDMSDTGWDTDLEIEGSGLNLFHKPRLIHVCALLHEETSS